MQEVYINAIGKCLPGEPVSTNEMEQYIGLVNGQRSRLGPMILRHNKIKTRYYALDKEGNTQWTCARLVASAITDALQHSELLHNDVRFLAAATTQGDFLVPGFASMVHAELALPPLEIASFQSVCASSMMALKDGYLQVKAGEHTNAVIGAGEFSSRFFQPGFYEQTEFLDENGDVPMSAEFLRWTLSDGGSAVVLENRPNCHSRSFKIEWIQLRSFANRFQPCMFAGGLRDPELPWPNTYNPPKASSEGLMILQQDFQLLAEMLPVWVGEYVKLVETGKISANEIDWFLCHYSTHSLKLELVKLLEKAGCMIPEEKWFNNLYSKGNTGSASLFMMLEELLYEKPLEVGQTVFCIVPESGRSIISFMKLKVV